MKHSLKINSLFIAVIFATSACAHDGNPHGYSLTDKGCYNTTVPLTACPSARCMVTEKGCNQCVCNEDLSHERDLRKRK